MLTNGLQILPQQVRYFRPFAHSLKPQVVGAFFVKNKLEKPG